MHTTPQTIQHKPHPRHPIPHTTNITQYRMTPQISVKVYKVGVLDFNEHFQVCLISDDTTYVGVTKSNDNHFQTVRSLNIHYWTNWNVIDKFVVSQPVYKAFPQGLLLRSYRTRQRHQDIIFGGRFGEGSGSEARWEYLVLGVIRWGEGNGGLF